MDRKGIYNIIIDVPERFIGKFKHCRISIIYVDDTKKFDIDIVDGQDNTILETQLDLVDMEAAIEFSKEEIKKFYD